MNKFKILFIDDEIEYVNSIADYFEVLGFETYKAATGTHGISLLKDTKPDLVLCDFKLPDIDGDKVLKYLKAYDETIPCVIITAFRDDHVVDQLLKEGALQVLSKPLSLKEVTALVMEIKNG